MRNSSFRPFILLVVVCVTTNISAQTDSLIFSQLHVKIRDFYNQYNGDSGLIYARQYQKLAYEKFGAISEYNARGLYYVGDGYRVKQNFQMALSYFKSSINIYGQLNSKIIDWVMYAVVFQRAGYVCEAMGANAEAKNYYLKDILLNDSLNRKYDNIQTYILLGNIYLVAGEYVKADSLYLSSKQVLDTLTTNTKAFRHYLQAAIYAEIGITYNETGNINKSIQYTKKALQLEEIAKQEGWISDDCIELYLNLAEAYASKNDFSNAYLMCKKAQDSLTSGDIVIKSLIIKARAYLYQQENKDYEAIKLYQTFINISDSLPAKSENYYPALVNIGVLYTSTKQYAKADSAFRKIINKLQDSGLIYSYPVIQAKKGLCINLIKEKKYAEATDSLLALINLDFEAMNKNFSGMSESEKLNYQSEADKVFDLLYICLHNNQSTPQNTVNNIYKAELQRKGLILRNRLNELSTVRNSNNTLLINLYADWLTNNEILSKQYSLPYNQRLFKIDSLEEINNTLEKKVAAKSSLLAKTDEHILPASLKPIAASANIEFVRYNYKSLSAVKDSGFYAVFITTSTDSLPHFTDLCSEQQLINLMKDKTGKWINENQLTQSIYGKQNKGSKLLYYLIWEKINEHLPGIKIINYSTAGLLNNIAFPAIYDGKNYLINHYSFNRYFSLQQSFTSATNMKMPEQINIWGNINYTTAHYSNDSLLQNTSVHQKKPSSPSDDFALGSSVKDISNEPLQSFNTDEVRHLKKIFTDNKVIVHASENNNATEDNFKQQSASLSGILHISTHGFYTAFNESHIKSSSPSSYISGNTNPLFRCGLAFAGVNYYWLNGKLNNNHDDGILTGYEISQLDLHNVQLVTLSACETGLGDITNNEGDIGLQRAFKIAGVKTMLVSLWQVPAKQTSQLLTLFYKNWLEGQQSDEALQSAELTMEKQYPPYFWAGFVLIK